MKPAELTGLISGDDLKPEAVIRASSTDEKSIFWTSQESRDLRLDAEQAERWSVKKTNKRSIRLERSKPLDRQLVDDVWSLLHRMGFKELNIGPTMILDAHDGAGHEVDVFARDAETVFVVLCTTRDNGKQSVKALIERIATMREDVIKAVHSHYGRTPKLKVKFAIATRGVSWRASDIDRAQGEHVAAIADDDFHYYSRLTDILRTAARYQFLGRYLSGEKVEGLRTRVPATRGKVGGTLFYNFLMSPHDLLRIAYISHMAKSVTENLDTYQRMVKPARLKAIGRYISEGGTFPTNIVVNLKQDNLQFDVTETFGDTATGTLTLPGRYGSAWVIDGQHRLYGHAYSARDAEADQSVVSVLAYENMAIRDEIQMFIDINTQQVKVTRNLVNEIVSSLDIEHEDPKRRLEALCARVALKLDGLEGSPVKNRVLTVAQDRNNFRCLTLTSLADGIAENNLLGSVHKSGKHAAAIMPGPLADLGDEALRTLAKASQTISSYLRLFAEPLSEHWSLGDAKGGYLCTNLGLRALLLLLRRIVSYIERDGTRVVTMEPEELIEVIRPIVKPLVQYFASADVADVQRFRNRGSSLLSVSQNGLQLMAIIYEAVPAFEFIEVREYLENQDEEGTRQAKDMIDEINRILFADVIGRLKEKFGEEKEAWWVQGVPKSVRNDCDRNFNENNGEHERWRYLFFVNYADIVTYGDNWELFKDHYNFYGKGTKTNLVRWIGKVNKARTVTHHAEKGPLSKDQVAFVKRVHELVLEHIQNQVPVDVKARYLVEAEEITA